MLEENSQYTPACFVLGIRSRFRGEELIADLESQGLAPRRVFGIDASVLNDQQLSGMVDQQASRMIPGRELSLGEVACALGHQEIYSQFLDGEEPWALILEDDAVLVEDIKCVVDQLSKFQNPTIVQLHGTRAGPRGIFLLGKITATKDNGLNSEIAIVRKLEGTYGAYGYLINRSAAEIVIRESEGQKIISYADWPFLWRNKVEFWETSTDFVKHSGKSQIDSDNGGLKRDQLFSDSGSGRISRRIISFAVNFSTISSWRFRRLGYPAPTFYFNKVIMPLKRRGVRLEQAAIAFMSRSKT